MAQHLNQQLPLDAAFVDETGKAVHLGDYFGKHPFSGIDGVLQLPAALCSEELDGLDERARDGEADPGQRLQMSSS